MSTARNIKWGIMVMAVAALCALIALPAYAAYEDSLKGYWKMDDLSLDDDFSGTSLNTNRWYYAGGTYSVNNDLAVSGTSTFFYSNQSLAGDFDMQVSYLNSQFGGTSGYKQIQFCANISDGKAVVSDRIKNNASSYYERVDYTGTWNGGTVVSTSDTSGKLRVTRSGSTLNSYYWTGSAWSSLSPPSQAASSSQSSNVMLGIYSNGEPVSTHFDDFKVVNGETVSDAAGSNPGTIYGATQVAGKTGNNTALNFDGVDDYVKLGAVSGYSANTLTVSGWVNLETANRYNTIWSNYLDNSNRIYMSVSSGNNLYVYGVEEGSIAVALTDPSAFQTGVWTHVAATFDSNANVSTLYVNGAQVAAQGYSAVTVNNNIIGRYAGVSEDFDGSMDDFAIWSRALDGNEISMLYGLGTEKFEWLTLGVNDQAALNLGYTTSELKLLADLYEEGNTGMSELIDGVTWRYLSGDLPGDIGGTTYNYGDAWTYDGRSYIKLGSGLEGSPVPEPGCAFGLLLGFFVPGLRKVLKRKVRG